MTIHDDVAKALGLGPPELQSFTWMEMDVVEQLRLHMIWTEWLKACRELLPDVVGVEFALDWESDDEGDSYPYINWEGLRLKGADGEVSLPSEHYDLFEDLTKPSREQLTEGLDFRESHLDFMSKKEVLVALDSIKAKINATMIGE